MITEKVGHHTQQRMPSWTGPGVRTSDDQATEDGEHYHVADRVDAQGPIRVSFKFFYGCPLGFAGVYLRSVRRPTRLQ